jgi:RHS repeat-associated protein
VSGGASYTASQTWNSAGRRTGLGVGTFSYGFSWQADGMLLSVAGPAGYGNGAYTYDSAGQLLTRTFFPRVTSITQRDGNGRPMAVNTTINGTNVLTETLSFAPDGLLASHVLHRPDFTDVRSYAYANQSRRLTQEIVGLSATNSWTNAFAYDSGIPGGPGVLTSGGQAAGTNVVWKAGTDAFSRVNVATNSVAQRQAYGMLNGTATMTALLDGNPMAVTTVGSNDVYEWRAQLALQPGTHKLIVNALNWSGYYTASATNTFTNNAADRVQSAYAGNGEVTNRAWISASGQTNATQSLSWDARDRLHGVTYLDSNTNGYIWSAIYDPLGRRLSTTTIFITNGITVSNLPSTISQYFDPSVQFLELGETDSGVTTWKLYGPDLNGVYGGMQGVGGLEAVVNGPLQSSPVVSDIRGNGYAIYNVAQGSLSWYPSRVTGFGAVTGYQPLPLADGASVAQASAWRGKWADITGLYCLGNRYYDPIAGNWLGADPLGHNADPSLYGFCNGDPVNMFDPDGRCAQASHNQYPVDVRNLYGSGLGGETVNAQNFIAYGNQNPNATIDPNSLEGQLAILGQAHANGYNGVNVASGEGYTDEWGFTHQTFCYSCHDPNDPVAQLRNQVAGNTVNSSWGAFVAQNALAFVPAEGMIGDAGPVLSQLTQGVDYEAQRLAILNLPKNTTVFQPTPEQVQSAAFQVIVGPPQYTAAGDLVGTISDSTQGGLLEIKGGSSTLNSSYQLRLQTYNSVVNNVPLTIETTRPVNPTFMNYLQNWGVTVRPPSNP